jgi:type IVB pilus formation R64 PilN family outer membrane protein
MSAKTKILWLLTMSSACVGLVGCAIDQLSRQAREHTKRQESSLVARAREFEQAVQAGPQTQAHHTRVNKPWVSGKPIALARELSLPKALRADVKTTLIFKHPSASLSEIAQRIAQATDIPVRVNPDALLPAGHFLPRLSNAQSTSSASATTFSSMPSGTRALSKILDHIAASQQVRWRYNGEVIEFYRTQTRAFDIRALSLSASASMRLGKSSSQDSQGFDSAAQTELSLTSHTLMQDVVKQLEPFLTRAGVITAQPGSLSSVVITDVPPALDAVADYLERLNRRLTRRVRLVFEQITVTRSQHHDQGIDWQFSLASDLASLDLATAQSGSAPAMLSVSGATSLAGLTSGLVLKAVSRYADVVRHTTVPVMTLNRRPVTHAVRSTFTYVDEVKSVALRDEDKKGTSTLPGIAVNQKRETVGAFLTLVPDVQDDGEVLLSVAFDNTVAMPLKTLNFGAAQNQLQVQQLDLRGNGTVQQVVVYPGRPSLIAGFEHQTNEVSQSRRSPHAPKIFGGDDSVERQKTMTLIFVTAQVQDGV